MKPRRATPLEHALRRLCWKQPDILDGANVKKKQQMVQMTALNIEIERAEEVFTDQIRGVMVRALRQ
jgi:hypothetical protein